MRRPPVVTEDHSCQDCGGGVLTDTLFIHTPDQQAHRQTGSTHARMLSSGMAFEGREEALRGCSFEPRWLKQSTSASTTLKRQSFYVETHAAEPTSPSICGKQAQAALCISGDTGASRPTPVP